MSFLHVIYDCLTDTVHTDPAGLFPVIFLLSLKS